MCGIAGELSFSDAPSGADWPTLSGMMARRGPDDAGEWRSQDLRCTFVFRRLSILDLSPNGHQPMVAGGNRYAIVYNGEIYNYRELRAELAASGVTFRSDGDTEVLLHALIRWGSAALARLNGIFALAFYDAHERKLLVARDHAGIKPLYLLRSAQGVAFASQYDQILAHPWSAACRVSEPALGLYLRLAFVPAPFAILDGTEMLEPGAWVEIDARGTVRRGRHFDLPVYREPRITGDDAVAAVDAAIGNAVERQLVSDVPVAAFLSGGVDSPLVVAKMRAAQSHRTRAFTIGNPGDRTDESADAAAYAAALDVDHVIRHTSPDEALALIDDAVAACGEPFGDYSLLPTMLVSRLAASEFKVVLSGDGGDELFWGYVRRFAPMIGRAERFRRPYGLRRAEWRGRRLLGRTQQHDDLRWRSLGDMQIAKHTHLPSGWLERVFPTLPRWPGEFHGFEFDGYEPDRAAQWLRWNELNCHLTMVLLKVDRASMFHSLEVRVPLLDKEVIRTALEVDWRACLDLEHGIGKLPLRRALGRIVPRVSEGKRGFEVPMAKWLRSSLRELFEAELLSRDSLLGLPLDRAALRTLFARHLDSTHDFAWGLWPLLSLALWERTHFQRRAPAEASAPPRVRVAAGT